MKTADLLIGADELTEMFTGLIREKKLSHAYMLEGAHGTGKKSLAKYLAAALVCGGNTDNCVYLDKINCWSCPDIRLISRDEGKKNISVESVRNMIDDVYLTPTELDFKMYVFDGAETLSQQAQNALLKVIEEPPENVYILLLCEDGRAILPTVRSRVQRIKMPLLNENEIRAFLKSKCGGSALSDNEKTEFAVRLCEGAPGRALELITDGGEEYKTYLSVKTVIDIQADKNRGVSYYDLISVIQKSAQSRDSIILLSSYLLKAYRDILSAKMSDKVKGVFFSSAEADKYVKNFSLGAVKDSIAAVTKIACDSDYNFNTALAASALAVLLWRAA